MSSCWTSSPPGSSPARGPSRRKPRAAGQRRAARVCRRRARSHRRRAAGRGALPPSSPAPGQLAGLCARLGIPGHGITVPPAAGLPERWLSMLTHHRRKPEVTPAPGSWAATAAELPEVDGVRLAVLGLHQAERGTIVHLHAGGVTMEDDWEYHRAVRPLPALWIRDHAGRWHATSHYAPDRWARAARSPWSWRSPRRWRRAPRGSTWWPPGYRPRSRPGCRSAGRGIHDSDPSRLPHLGRAPRHPWSRWTPRAGRGS